MLFWIICGGLALVAAALVALPLLRTTGADDGPDRREVEIYRAQLAEIDRDIARGVITGEEAERTRTEVARRLLAADAAAPRAMAEAPRGASFVMAALAVALVAGGGIALYGRLGVANASGPFPDIPRAARIAASEERSAARISQEQAMETVAAGTPAPDPEHLALVERLRAVVAENPEDEEGLNWLVRGEVGIGDYAGALEAQDRLIALQPEGSPSRRTEVVNRLDMMVSAVRGYVSPEAEALALRLLDENPASLPGRYYLGLHFQQIDRPDLAFRMWRGVVAEGPPQSPHVELARQFIEEAAFRAGVDYTLPPLPGADALPGPTAEDMAAAAEMSAEDRAAMVEGMVARLSDRLATEGGPASDWARLIGALGVLGQTERASAILGEARQVFAGRTEELALIEAAGREAGLE